jgi:hypothetical protein
MPDSKRGTEPLMCSICGSEIKLPPWQTGLVGGYPAQPVNPGHACYRCDWDVVMPARYRALHAHALANDGGEN